MRITLWRNLSLELPNREYAREAVSHVKIASLSPDGSSYVSVLNDSHIAIYGIEDSCGDSSSAKGECPSPEDAVDVQPTSSIDCYDDVRDICFFPNFTASDLDSCCFLVASRGTPVHLYDIRGGKHHFAYKPINIHEELAEVYSLNFHPLGKYFLCGSKGAIHVFDVESPGTDIEMRRLYTNRKRGQCGIISAIAHNPYASSMYACGDYNSNIGIYDHNASRYDSLFGGFGDTTYPMGPVTQIRWVTEHTLLEGSRNDVYIRMFDIRGTCEEPVIRFRRPAKNNQRIEFDLKNNMLVSGTSDGDVIAYDISSDEPKMKTKVADTTVSSVSYHPRMPFMLTASGTRTFGMDPEDEDISTVAGMSLWRILDEDSINSTTGTNA